MITERAGIDLGRGKSGPDWFVVNEANVSYDHPYDLPLEHALNIDCVNAVRHALDVLQKNAPNNHWHGKNGIRKEKQNKKKYMKNPKFKSKSKSKKSKTKKRKSKK